MGKQARTTRSKEVNSSFTCCKLSIPLILQLNFIDAEIVDEILIFKFLKSFFICSSVALITQLPELQPPLALQKSVSNLQKPSPVANQEVCRCSCSKFFV